MSSAKTIYSDFNSSVSGPGNELRAKLFKNVEVPLGDSVLFL